MSTSCSSLKEGAYQRIQEKEEKSNLNS